MTLKPLMLAILCMWTVTSLKAQEKSAQSPALSLRDFHLPSGTAVDTNANAVILFDSGRVDFVSSKSGRSIDCVIKRRRRVKILHAQGFDAATIKIPLYGRDEYKDRIENIVAVTYNEENEKVVPAVLNPGDVFESKLSKYVSEVKFTMPNLREGSVIEYNYSIVSPHYYYIPSWSFQHINLPCLSSNFEMKLPDFIRYVVVQNGADSIRFTSTSEGYKIMNIGRASVGSGYHTLKWTAANLAAFKTQAFTYYAQDYADRISFNFVSINFSEDQGRIPSWRSVTADLLTDPDFGAMIAEGRTSNLFNTMEKITAADDNVMKAAKSIYAYVRDNFTCIDDDNIYTTTDLYEVNKKKQGNTADLNLLLIALLREKGLHADPVILSTREYGVHPEAYPALNRLNYVIARLKIYGDTVYLDASHPRLGFGKLPLECYNGHGRIISTTDTGNVYLYPESVKEMEQTTVFISNDEKQNGVMSGSYQSVPTYHRAYELRTALRKEGQETYFKKLSNPAVQDFMIDSHGIDSLNKYDEPVNLHYDFHFTTGNEPGGLIYFNPMMSEGMQTNPLMAAERAYPVEMPAPVDKLYVLNMEIPAGYVIEEMPAPAKFAFNGNEGTFEYIIQKDETVVQLRSRLKISRAVFRPEEYNDLRQFFAQVVKKQAEQIVFKKKK